MNIRKILLIALIGVLVVAAIGAGGFVVWANNASPASPNAVAALTSDASVQFTTTNGWLVFEPSNPSAASYPMDTGLIIYPGGRVDYRAYAPLARAIAAEGYLVVIVPAPLNLAFFDINAAQRVMDAYPEIEHWAVAGHSLGGVAASSFAAANPDKVEGIAFWASYPSGNMSTFPGQVVSIYGTNDGLASPSKIDESRPNLPATTEFVAIEGGNHAQFGDYGPQEGDNPATISRAEQQAQIAAATVSMLEQLNQ